MGVNNSFWPSHPVDNNRGLTPKSVKQEAVLIFEHIFQHLKQFLKERGEVLNAATVYRVGHIKRGQFTFLSASLYFSKKGAY